MMIFLLHLLLVVLVIFPLIFDINILELFGFITEGLVFEVIEGSWVGQVTCFKA